MKQKTKDKKQKYVVGLQIENKQVYLDFKALTTKKDIPLPEAFEIALKDFVKKYENN